jgi:hypothetical protein
MLQRFKLLPFRPEFQILENTMFRKLDLFPLPQMKREEYPYSVGPLRKS